MTLMEQVNDYGPRDHDCDHCGSTVAKLYRYPLSGGRNYLCGMCAVRESGEPLCDYCNRPTFGDYRRISRAHTVTNACGVCTDKWDGAI